MQDFTDSAQSIRKIPSPFLDDIFIRNDSPLPGTPEIHQQAMSQCISVLESLISDTNRPRHWGASGRTILISAPRAGYGKSHLIGRLRSTTESLIAAVDLPFDPSRSISWKMVLASFLRQYSGTPCPQHTTCSLLEETGRFFLANLVRAAMAHDAVNERNCPESDESLRLEYRDLFSQHSKSKILSWVNKRSKELAKAAAAPMKNRWNISQSEVNFWAGLFLDFTHGQEDALEPLRGLSDGEARERVLQLMQIASECRPITVIVDHLDGFFGSDTAGMAIAEILTSIRTEVPKTLTLLCINDDLWESIFKERLPTAWLDRLTGETTRLMSITPKAARALITARLASIDVSSKQADEFVAELSEKNSWSDGDSILFPRDVIRQARQEWEIRGSHFFLSPPEQQTSFTPPANISSTAVKAPSKTFSSPPLLEEEKAPFTSRPPVEPIEEPARAETRENAPVPQEEQPSGIESIINDIRGSGYSVMSEGASVQRPPQAEAPVENPPPTKAPPETLQAGPLSIRPSEKKPITPLSDKNFAAPKKSPSILQSILPKSILPKSTQKRATRKQSENGNVLRPPLSDNLEQSLRDREAQFSHKSQTLQLDLQRMENLLRNVGKHHPALAQTEEHYPSSRSACLRWMVRDQSILIGFDSPQNVYFWNTLLQQSFEADQSEKITTFSHKSQQFNPSLFTSFGFSHDLVQSRIDVVEMNDKELAMVYAAESLITDAAESDNEAKAIELVTRRLDPLWRRIIQPIAVKS